MRGIFISVEGVDGAGKSTHLQFIKDYLHSKGKDVLVTREPGGTPLGEGIRDLLLHSSNMHPITELMLMFASRQELIAKIIEPQLSDGICVIADRYIDSSVAYQGFGRGIDLKKVYKTISLLEPPLKTDLTLLFDAPLSTIIGRMDRNKTKDRIESETKEFFTKVQQGYYGIARNNTQRIKIINTDQNKTDTRVCIQQYLDQLLVEIK